MNHDDTPTRGSAPTSTTDAAPGSPPTVADPGRVVIVGAGPAGLTAAHALVKHGHASTVLEADDIVGGISRTPVRDGWRFDIGGHRFFTKVDRVRDLWHEILPDGEFLTRPRMSRIFYEGKYYDYPIKPFNALRNLGFVEAVRCIASFLWVRIRPPRDLSTLEGYIARNYGWRLYHHFFETYNEKVWGVPASELSADWGAQRIKGMSLWNAVWEPIRSRIVGRRSGGNVVTSLIEEFEYPRHGPGQMWERCRDLVVEGGSSVEMGAEVERIRRTDDGVHEVITTDGRTFPTDHLISSMPVPHLVHAMEPPAPAAVRAAATELTHRDFLTVALVVPEEAGFPDNWIYIHAPEVEVGRIQNFGSWSPHMVKDGRTCLGLEYFVFEGDGLWTKSDDDLVALATAELDALGLVDASAVERGFVVRMPRAYPVYDDAYQRNVDIVRRWLADEVPNVHPVGRNGMHRYNNQDHSMLTALLTVENLLGADHDIWSVNVDEEYHETKGSTDDGRGTGRSAPVTSRR